MSSLPSSPDSGARERPPPYFVHLNVHSEFSLVDGIVRIKPLVAAVAAANMPAVALTDHNNLFATVRFYSAAEAAGVKPLIGCDLGLANANGAGAASRLLLLCQNRTGYRNLTRLVTRAYAEGQTAGTPLADAAWLEDANEGLIVLSGGCRGDVGQALAGGRADDARRALERWAAWFPDRYYLELQRTGRTGEDAYVEDALCLAGEFDLPVVATNDVRFIEASDFEAHEARVCIHEGRTLSDPRRVRHYSGSQYLRSPEQMQALFEDLPEAIENTIHIARRCNVELEIGKSYLPDFPVPAGHDTESWLREQAAGGLTRRLERLRELDTRAGASTAVRNSAGNTPGNGRRTGAPANGAGQRAGDGAGTVAPVDAKGASSNVQPSPRDEQSYQSRLKLELDVIAEMGFSGYFLIVADFIQWAKDNGIPVGPGRGSGAGSLVAYSLSITDLDPLAHDLLFERFLNPERVSLPDFDIDFCMDGRDRVIDYVSERYGGASGSATSRSGNWQTDDTGSGNGPGAPGADDERVAQIITFGTMAARAVVRDVGRVLGHGYGFVDELAKLIPFELGITLSEALAEEPLKSRYREDEEARTLFDLARKLEGLARNAGRHAGGVVIAPGPLTDFTALYREQGSSSPVTQYDKNDVESVGLVKFDFLGLRTLTIIDSAMRTINAERTLTGREPIDINTLPTDDAATYELIRTGRTTAIFQLESNGMQDLIRRLGPDCFDDLVALVALFRPGPLQSGMVDDFIDRKHGRARVDYPHPDVESILEPTYGVILYQEQVMQIAQVLAGYSLGGADLLRRAMGKKLPEEMAKQRQGFVDGAVARGVEAKEAEYI
ncbi:MAG: DNA polymerase III subunit alpha, partial [Gammaproteobacteria bacterium]